MTEPVLRVARLQEEEIPELIAVKAQVYGLEPTETSDYYRWKFFANPHRGPEVPFWTLREGERLVGGIGALPVRMQVGGRERLGEFACDMFVERGRQRSGLGTVLMDAYIRESPWPLMMNTSPSLSRFLAKRGFVDRSDRVGFSVLPLRPGALLAARRSGGAGAAALRLADPLFRLALETRRVFLGARLDPAVTVEETKIIGDRAEAIWKEAAADYGIVVIRDRAYLEWKYERHPSWSYRILLASRGGRPEGYAVFRLRPGSGGALAIVPEIFAARGAAAVRLALIDRVIRAARGARAIAVKILATDPTVQEDLRRLGFIRTGASPGFFIPRQPGLDGPEILDLDRWYLTGGDSDLDYGA